mmetsp:Transcript_87861/g.151696  ORF Transcript_87861/g.151696 Transcript_87861/m.151696 type:complete len:227 (-) Transcript_87861:70-750(-)
MGPSARLLLNSLALALLSASRAWRGTNRLVDGLRAGHPLHYPPELPVAPGAIPTEHPLIVESKPKQAVLRPVMLGLLLFSSLVAAGYAAFTRITSAKAVWDDAFTSAKAVWDKHGSTVDAQAATQLRAEKALEAAKKALMASKEAVSRSALSCLAARFGLQVTERPLEESPSPSNTDHRGDECIESTDAADIEARHDAATSEDDASIEMELGSFLAAKLKAGNAQR